MANEIQIMYLLLTVSNGFHQSYDVAKNLFNDLFIKKSYNKQVRPINDQNDDILVTVNFNIHNFDELADKIAVSGYLDVIWWDDQLVWNRSAYNDIYDMIVLQLRLHHRNECIEKCKIFEIAVKLQRRICCWRNKTKSDTHERQHTNVKDGCAIENASPKMHDSEDAIKWRDVSSAINFFAFWILMGTDLVITLLVFICIGVNRLII
ncbi:unnamed protein product [Mytilus edulis]|uniref:Neurotransmitter-gated ion-channel ligand-binding domain-containing protein n=1 Tax=Mytilus edulis TaxID=6550 RepID=A0A8S3PVQ8_MYTED|nr:unnamed protein product [Mytilus edulis]